MSRTGHPIIGADLAGQAGMVGKAAVLWLLILAVLGVAVVDGVSIARTTLHASEVASEAALEGATAFRVEGRSAFAACEAVAVRVEELGPMLEMGPKGCVVDASTGRVSVTLRTVATTVIAGRFEPSERYTRIVVTEANGQSKV
jgi:hypothetical protein